MEPNFVIIDNKYFISELEKTLKNDINTVTKNKYQVLAINLVKINSTTLYKIFNLLSKTHISCGFKAKCFVCPMVNT